MCPRPPKKLPLTPHHLGGSLVNQVGNCEDTIITQNMVGKLAFPHYFQKVYGSRNKKKNRSIWDSLFLRIDLFFLGQAKSHLKSSQVNEVSNWKNHFWSKIGSD